MDRIRKRRLELGMTQEELARKVGVSRNAISMYETGNRTPEYDTVGMLAKALNTTAIYLLGLEDEIPVYLEQKGES